MTYVTGPETRKDEKWRTGRAQKEKAGTARVFGSPVGRWRGAQHWYSSSVMDEGDNALSSIPVRNNAAFPVIHCLPLSIHSLSPSLINALKLLHNNKPLVTVSIIHFSLCFCLEMLMVFKIKRMINYPLLLG